MVVANRLEMSAMRNLQVPGEGRRKLTDEKKNISTFRLRQSLLGFASNYLCVFVANHVAEYIIFDTFPREHGRMVARFGPFSRLGFFALCDTK